MPYVSRAQQGWAHTPAGEKALGGPAKVHEWDQATKGKYGSLPQHVSAHAQGGPIMNKGYQGKTESYAQGGAVLGRSTDFMKSPDRFRGSLQPNPKIEGTEDVWGKGSSKKNPVGKDKSEKPVKPRS